ncbi:hypothetical protein [Streptomyces tricolor]
MIVHTSVGIDEISSAIDLWFIGVEVCGLSLWGAAHVCGVTTVKKRESISCWEASAALMRSVWDSGRRPWRSQVG